MKVKREVWTVLIVCISLVFASFISSVLVFALAGEQTQAGQEAVAAASGELTGAQPFSSQQVTAQVSYLSRFDGSALKNLPVNTESRMVKVVGSGAVTRALFATTTDASATGRQLSAYERLLRGETIYISRDEGNVLSNYLRENKIIYAPKQVRRTFDSASPLSAGGGLATTTSAEVLNEEGGWEDSPEDKNKLNNINDPNQSPLSGTITASLPGSAQPKDIGNGAYCRAGAVA